MLIIAAEVSSIYFAGGTFNPYHIHEFYVKEFVQLLKDTFNSKLEVFFQRPIKENHIFWSFLRNFIFRKKSIIIPSRPGMTGIDIIYIVRKK